MKCPKCGKDVELQKKQVGVDENGKPIFNEYAICRDCKKQWNLDKQKVKKAANANASNHTQSKENTAVKESPAAGKAETIKSAAPKKKPVSPAAKDQKPVSPGQKPTPVKPAGSSKVSPAKAASGKVVPESGTAPAKAGSEKAATPGKAAPVTNAASLKTAPTKAAPAKSAASDPKSTGQVKKAAPTGKNPSGSKPAPSGKTGPVKKTTPDGKPLPKKKTASSNTGSHKPAKAPEEPRYSNIPPEKVRAKREKAVRESYEDMLAADPNRKPAKKKRPVPADDSTPKRKPVPAAASDKKRPVVQPEIDVEERRGEPKPKFRALRIIFGIVSIAAFAFFAYKGFLTGLNNITAGTNATTGTIYIILALCMLVSGLLLLIMQKKRTVFAFILPMIFYIASAVVAFLKRGDDKFLMYGAIVGAALAVIFLILSIASRGGDEEDDFDDDYDDPFEDDYDD